MDKVSFNLYPLTHLSSEPLTREVFLSLREFLERNRIYFEPFFFQHFVSRQKQQLKLCRLKFTAAVLSFINDKREMPVSTYFWVGCVWVGVAQAWILWGRKRAYFCTLFIKKMLRILNNGVFS